MPRYAAALTKDELIEKLRDKLSGFPELAEEFDVDLSTDAGVIHATANAIHAREDYPVFPKVTADWEKIHFSDENYDYTGTIPMAKDNGFFGLQTLPGGLTCLVGWFGGDWEHPLAMILYHDGKTFRGYVPTKGNTFNHKTKTAFGNDENEDAAAVLAQYPNMPALAGKTRQDVAAMLYDHGFMDVTADPAAMIADIEARIIVR